MSGDTFDRIDALTRYATGEGRSLLELAMSWLISQPNVPSVIAGATSAEQVKQNAAAVSWVLASDQLAEVAGLSA